MGKNRCIYAGWWLVCFWSVQWAQPVCAQASAEDEFDEYLSSIEADFYSFEDSINRDFADYLEQAWQAFTVYEGTEPPAYAACPSFTVAAEAVAGDSPRGSFFGTPLLFPSGEGERVALSGLSEKEVAAGWRQLGRADFTPFFRAYAGYSRQFSLNDWGEYRLLEYASRQLYPSSSTRERTLFLFFALSNAGYKTKIGRVGKEALVVLLPFVEEVYKLPFIRVGERKYYVMDPPSGQLKTLYSILSDFPKAEKLLSLRVSEALDFPESERTRSFTGKYPFSLSLNRNLLDFYASFPLCDLSVYFSAEPSKAFVSAMDRVVKGRLRGKSRSEQIAYLLDFVQQGFTHRPDVEVHKTEAYYFPEETAFYPYADCEDLSVFLSWLISRYVTSEVLVLYYPTHVAVAVECLEGGATFTFGEKEYLVCDPSYRGALPGHIIPACASLTPVIVSYSKQKSVK